MTPTEISEIEVFISHASEDNERFARPLAELIENAGIKVWYDKFSLRVGDSLRASIDRGLARCRYAVVILSPAFLNKAWTNWELDGLVQRHLDEGDMLLPVWLDVDAASIRRVSPPLANIVPVQGDGGVDSVAAALVSRIRGEQENTTIALLPSTVSAIGYFEYFLRPLLRSLSENSVAEIATDTAGKRLSARRWSVRIVAPEPNDPFSNSSSFAESNGLTSVTISLPPGRKMFTFARIDSEDAVTFYDYANNLKMAYAAIDFSVDQKNYPLTADQLKGIEKANFKKTLRRLLLDRSGHALSDLVQIE